MNNAFVNLLVRWAVLAFGVTLSTKMVNGIYCDTGGTLVLVVLVLSFFNAVLKPLLVLFTLPFIVLSLGVGVWLINSLLLFAVGRLVEGFHVASFGTAMWGALIISLTNLLVNQLLGRKNGPRPPGGPRPPTTPPPSSRSLGKNDDVIDI